MSQKGKIAILAVGGLIMLCVCGIVLVVWFSARQTNITDPERVAQVSAGIAAYDLPPGYAEDGAISVLGIKAIFIVPEENSSSGGPVIIMASIPAAYEASQADIEQSLQRGIGQQNLQLELIGEELMTVRGQSVSFRKLEGADETGRTLRQMTGVFNGEDGLTLLTFLGYTNTWNQTTVEGFIQSIR